MNVISLILASRWLLGPGRIAHAVRGLTPTGSLAFLRFLTSAALTSVVLASVAQAAELDFAFTLTNAAQSASLRLRVELDGQPLAEAIRPRFAKLFSHLDRDGNQKLNADELAAAPSAGWLRRATWGYLAGNHVEPITLAEADSDHDDSVSLPELQVWYATHGVGTITAVAARSQMTRVLTDALWRTLDDDRDGRLSAEELVAAPERLRKLDEDDDDLVSAREIASSVEQPYPFATSRLSEPHFEIAPRTEPHQTTDLPVVARLSLKNSIAEVARVQATDSTTVVSNGITFPVGDCVGSLLPAQSRANRWRDLIEPQAQAHFRAADKDQDDAVTADEAAHAPNRSLRTLFDFADHNRDRRVTTAEWQTALETLAPVAESNVLLTILIHERSLFELVDQNRDGSLSRAERQAFATTGRTVARTDLPTTVTLFVSLGQPGSASKSSDKAPAWFIALDRNHDGIVTRTEFLGPRTEFDRLDFNHDGKLTTQESLR